mmetsp:Transcript_19232/g.49989  ORF Transcript_19232/g.49989 Transcript_19232/m.49989 type:complete len:89 (+) Transcript_19232:153-419(+)
MPASQRFNAAERARLAHGTRVLSLYMAVYFGVGLVYPALAGEAAIRTAFRHAGWIENVPLQSPPPCSGTTLLHPPPPPPGAATSRGES